MTKNSGCSFLQVSVLYARSYCKLLILTSYTKFELNSLRNNERTNYRYFGCHDTVKVRNDVIFKQWYDVMNCFAKFEKFLPHSIIIPSFLTVGSQMAELEREGHFAPSPT